MKLIQLTAINLDLEKEYALALRRAAGAPGLALRRAAGAPGDDPEFADAEEGEVPPAASTGPVTEPAGLYYPCAIVNPERTVRDFHPRKDERTGTRIVFQNGAAQPVKESFADVLAKFASLNN